MAENPKPNATQQSAQNLGATAANPGATATEGAPTATEVTTTEPLEDEAPYPSQADVDDIRLGRFGATPKRKREAKATDGQSSGYKTR